MLSYPKLIKTLVTTSVFTFSLVYSLLLPTVLAQETSNGPILGLDFVNQQLTEQLLNKTRALSNPELIKAQAHYYRSMYQALIESGFSKDEALKVVVAMASADK